MVWSGAWPPHEVDLSRKRLTDLVSLVKDFNDENGDAAHAALARFLTVRACGHVEFTFDECVAEFARTKSHPYIAAHVRGGLFRGRNPRPDDLVDRLRRMCPPWAEEFDAFLSDSDNLRRRELGLLVDRRNGISHGQNEGLGVRKALDLANLALEVGDWLADKLDPAGSTESATV